MAFLWLWSGIQPALFALPQSLDLLAQVGVQAAYRVPLFALSCVLDVFFGLGCATRLRHRAWFWAAQAAVRAFLAARSEWEIVIPEASADSEAQGTPAAPVAREQGQEA